MRKQKVSAHEGKHRTKTEQGTQTRQESKSEILMDIKFIGKGSAPCGGSTHGTAVHGFLVRTFFAN